MADYASLIRPTNYELSRRINGHALAGSVQPQLRDVAGIGLKLIPFHALDDVRQHRIGAARKADLFVLAHHEAVEEFDLRAPAFLHILAHRSPWMVRTSAFAILRLK